MHLNIFLSYSLFGTHQLILDMTTPQRESYGISRYHQTFENTFWKKVKKFVYKKTNTSRFLKAVFNWNAFRILDYSTV